MSHTIRFTQSRRDWHALHTILERCQNAKAAGIIDGYDTHLDAVANVMVYEIRFP